MYMAQYELKKTSLHRLLELVKVHKCVKLATKNFRNIFFPLKLFNFGHYQVKKDAEHNR